MKYSKEHVWVKVEGDVAELGLTNFKRSKLRKIIYVDMPETNEEVNKGEALFSTETKKKQFEFISPLSGEIIECNEELLDDPERLNKNAEEEFIVKIKVSNLDELSELLSEAEYKKICE